MEDQHVNTLILTERLYQQRHKRNQTKNIHRQTIATVAEELDSPSHAVCFQMETTLHSSYLASFYFALTCGPGRPRSATKTVFQFQSLVLLKSNPQHENASDVIEHGVVAVSLLSRFTTWLWNWMTH